MVGTHKSSIKKCSVVFSPSSGTNKYEKISFLNMFLCAFYHIWFIYLFIYLRISVIYEFNINQKSTVAYFMTF